MHKSLSQELAGPEDVTMSSSLNVRVQGHPSHVRRLTELQVYIDPMNGSDHGNGMLYQCE